MDTYFAPAQRTERRKFKNQIATISENPIMDSLLKTAGGLLVVLNEDRQIVALNHAFLKELGVKDIKAVLGFRLGESLHCVHADKKPNGCGTTEYCPSCGAAIAMMAAIEKNQTSELTCALSTSKNGQPNDISLLIKAVPLTLDESRWILIYAQDITQQHFWANLERVFFHDINNVLTSVYGNIQLMDRMLPKTDEIQAVQAGIERIIREVQLQKTFSQKKQEGYFATFTTVSLSDIRKELHLIINGHQSSFRKNLIETWPADDALKIKTDLMLLTRVLGNMLINAFEASSGNEPVKLTVRVTAQCIVWEVRNHQYIPPALQKRIFQKHFTTKPTLGRGIGTYSMKLFGETYLKGSVCFSSSETDGTVFTFQLPR